MQKVIDKQNTFSHAVNLAICSHCMTVKNVYLNVKCTNEAPKEIVLKTLYHLK